MEPEKNTTVADIIRNHEKRIANLELQAQGWQKKVFWMIFVCVVGGDAIIRLLIWLVGRLF